MPITVIYNGSKKIGDSATSRRNHDTHNNLTNDTHNNLMNDNIAISLKELEEIKAEYRDMTMILEDAIKKRRDFEENEAKEVMNEVKLKEEKLEIAEKKKTKTMVLSKLKTKNPFINTKLKSKSLKEKKLWK